MSLEHEYAPSEKEPFSSSDSASPSWCYDQNCADGSVRQFSGRVTAVHGSEGERIRLLLSDITRGLLRWAEEQRRGDSEQDDSSS